ncbi:hypothetical protein ACHAXR_009836 [Thalassiosira sp. AJA248-18]
MSMKSRLFYLLLAIFTLSLGLITAAVDEGGSSNDDDTANSNDPQQIIIEENLGAEQQRGSSSSRTKEEADNVAAAANNIPDPTLDENSVVLITGAAGFLGSELALALRRTYSVKKLLLVDNLGIDSENESAYVPPPPDDTLNSNKQQQRIYEKLSEEELSMFEIKRQRAFRIFHELTEYNGSGVSNNGGGGGGGGAESIRFYRADMRPSIPEFFDFGEVPLLEGIFQSHPDITHVVHLAGSRGRMCVLSYIVGEVYGIHRAWQHSLLLFNLFLTCCLEIANHTDVPISAQNQAIPRNKDSVKTGRMEGLLEEMRLMLERASEEDGSEVKAQLPQLVYASSHEVYDRISTASANGKGSPHQPNPPPFQEDKPITTPSSLHGTAKLIDEVLASAYHSTHGIYSVGLRFFPVYGPWDAPGSEVFDLAERLAALNDNSAVYEDAIFDEDVKDYVYIDDAVDAIMSAMQYRPPGSLPPPVVFNVGTGKGSTLKDLRNHMAQHYPKLSGSQSSAGQQQRSAKANPIHADRLATKSYASTSRSESLLGFEPQISLAEGLAHTLTWHRDRALPYGRDPTIVEPFERQSMDRSITDSLAKSLGEECSPLDRECLRGAPVFPCSSECSRAERCTPSAWDDVATLSKIVTSGCDVVLYTILLDDGAEQIPSATAAANADSLPYVGAGLPADVGKRTQARCNIAFASDKSPLVQRLRSEGEEYLEDESENSGLPPLLRHGFWTVLPVSTPSSAADDSNSMMWIHAFDGTFALEYLPKLSPGRFFGSSVRYAVFAKPSILVGNLPTLLKRMEDGPPSRIGSTALMLSEKRQTCDPAQRGSTCTAWTRPAKNDSLQSSVYNMIRVALRGEILGGGLNSVIDSSFVVHSLREEDSRLFRCDVYGEVAQWGASSDEPALEFIISLHDLWSRAVSHWSGVEPWWISDANNSASSTSTAAEGGHGRNDDDNAKDDTADKNSRRRLLAESNGDDAERDQQLGTWMGILSSTEVQLFTHIIPSEGMGIIQLDHY